MTYNDLLRDTAQRKQDAITELNKALNGPGGFLVKAEIEKNPGSVAWAWLAKEFCEQLADHISEFIEQAGGVDSYEAREIFDIYVAYEDDDPDLYEKLPAEAQLFETE